MVVVKRLVLDVLKPHQPDVVEFCRQIASLSEGYQVCLDVDEVDENTQTLRLEIRGQAVVLEPIATAIADMGGSLHSIDVVEVHNDGAEG